MFPQIISLIMIGLIAGFLGSSVGAAGTTVLVPGLLLSGVTTNYKTALGTSLFTILAPLSIGAVYKFWKHGHVNVSNGLIMMVTYFFSATFTAAYLVDYISEKKLKLFYAAFLLLSSIYIFYKT
jgi:uncharacterized membrane protein YfcA